VKTVALLVLAATGAIGVEPNRAAVGESITISGPVGSLVAMQALDTGASAVGLGMTGENGLLVVRIPEVPPGSYRIVVAGEREAPVLEVTALSQGTSVALVAFGLFFVLAVMVAGVVVHRRWRDAIG